MPELQNIITPLIELKSTKRKFVCDSEQVQAFEAMKDPL